MERTQVPRSVQENPYAELGCVQERAESRQQSFRDITTPSKYLDSRSRFEQVFLASPRARELYSHVVPTPQKSDERKSFDHYFNKMAEEYHDKIGLNNSTIDSLLANQSVTSAKPKTIFGVMYDEQFEMSPFKAGVDDSIIKKKVGLVLSRLEDDSDMTMNTRCETQKQKDSLKHKSRDFVPNCIKINSLGCNAGNLSYFMKNFEKAGGTSSSYNTLAFDVGKGIALLSESNSDEKIDVATAGEVDNGGLQIDGIEDSVNDDDINKAEIQFSFGSRSDGKDVVPDDNVKDGKGRGDSKINRKDGSGNDRSDNTRNKGGDNNLINKSPEKSEECRLNSSIEFHEGKKTPKLNTLKLWSIRALKNRTHMGIIVEGRRSEDPHGEIWHSTAIVLRIDARCVQTKSGSQYKLIGPMNDKLTLQYGFSPKFVKSFKNGFPVNWNFLVADHFNSQSSLESEDEKESERHPKNKKITDSKEVKHLTLTATPAESRPKRKRNSEALQTPENTQLPREVELKTTRSGRTVKPPLAWWRGQRIVTDCHYNVEIDPGREEHTARSSVYSVEFQLPMKVEISSNERKTQETSSNVGKETRKSPRLTMSVTDQNQPKQNSTEESDAAKQDKKKNLRKNTSTKNVQPEKQSPVESTDIRRKSARRKGKRIGMKIDRKAQPKQDLTRKSNAARKKEEKENQKICISMESPQHMIDNKGITIARTPPKLSSPNQSFEMAKSENVINSSKLSPAFKVFGIAGRSPLRATKSPQEINSDKESTSTENSKLVNSRGNTSKYEKQHKESGIGKNAQVTNVPCSDVIKPSSTSAVGDKSSSCSGNTRPNDPFEWRESSSSSEADIEGLKKKLFFSPRKNSNKEIRTQRVCKDNQADYEQQQCGQRNMSPLNRTGKSIEVTESDSVQGQRLQKKGLGKNKPKSVTEENNHTLKKPRRLLRACTDSESDTATSVEQVIVSKMPSPPKRVLRYHTRKSSNPKDVQTISIADSDEVNEKDSVQHSQPSSCYDGSDNTVLSGKNYKSAGRQKNVKKRVVPKRMVTLVEETTSTQSSDEESVGKYQQQSAKQAHLAAATNAIRKKGAQQQHPKDDNNSPRGLSKEKHKRNEGFCDNSFSTEQAFNLSKQIANKHTSRKQNATSIETLWSEDEMQRLNEALFLIPGHTPMFWQKISHKVATRTAQECQLKHQGQEIISKKVLAKGKKDSRSKVSSQQNEKKVTGGVGTIKRKREIRELLEQQDVDYEDDIFDSTPFKRKKDLKLPFNLNSISSDSDNDDSGDKEDEPSETEHGTSYKTPGSRTPSSRFRPLGPLSTSESKTSSWEFVSPSLLQPVNRKDMDYYIHKMQQRKRGIQAPGKHKAKQMRTSTPKKPSSSSNFPVALGSEIFEAHPTSDRDSEESVDDYFSDE